jgi:hypothetical protein
MVRGWAYCTAQIQAFTNVLYQKEMGLVGDIDVDDSLRGALLRNKDKNAALGCPISDRVREAYANFRGDA